MYPLAASAATLALSLFAMPLGLPEHSETLGRSLESVALSYCQTGDPGALETLSAYRSVPVDLVAHSGAGVSVDCGSL